VLVCTGHAPVTACVAFQALQAVHAFHSVRSVPSVASSPCVPQRSKRFKQSMRSKVCAAFQALQAVESKSSRGYKEAAWGGLSPPLARPLLLRRVAHRGVLVGCRLLADCLRGLALPGVACSRASPPAGVLICPHVVLVLCLQLLRHGRCLAQGLLRRRRGTSQHTCGSAAAGCHLRGLLQACMLGCCQGANAVRQAMGSSDSSAPCSAHLGQQPASGKVLALVQLQLGQVRVHRVLLLHGLGSGARCGTRKGGCCWCQRALSAAGACMWGLHVFASPPQVSVDPFAHWRLPTAYCYWSQ